ncbi:MAG: hypothetical protein LBN27_07790 [Prevotellaceae bacterium]|jgi:hypothetical protein|nr:hypothetical protein [Prevotellaceae bacterium]
MKKKIFILTSLLAIVAAVFVGCGDKDNEPKPQKQKKTLNVTLKDDNACSISGQYYETVLGQLEELRKDPTTGELVVNISCNDLSGMGRLSLRDALRAIDSAAVKNNAIIAPIVLYIGGAESAMSKMEPDVIAIMQKYGIQIVDYSQLH